MTRTYWRPLTVAAMSHRALDWPLDHLALTWVPGRSKPRSFFDTPVMVTLGSKKTSTGVVKSIRSTLKPSRNTRSGSSLIHQPGACPPARRSQVRRCLSRPAAPARAPWRASAGSRVLVAKVTFQTRPSSVSASHTLRRV
ncbi:Uncharacterised protein [Mycobacteroides abscessus subsp. abscessus]|nr:Uncharacterised protein [Mycobacteroides abscessus subsp. abscessus]